MTNKIKLVFPVLALGLILSSTAFAATATTEVKDIKTNKVTISTAKSSCVSAAKVVKTTAIKAANGALKTAKAACPTK